MAHRADGLNDIFEHDVKIRDNLNTTGGTIQETPINPKDIVNKKYVDDKFPVTHASTTGQTSSDHHIKTTSAEIDHDNIINTHNLTTDISHDSIADVSADDHHPQLHTIASHSDTSATGAELNTLTDTSDADSLHTHTGTNLTDDIFLKNNGDTATGDYNFDSGTFYIDATNNRVGIGTASPGKLLDVDGDIRIPSTGKLYTITANDLNYVNYNTWATRSGYGLNFYTTGVNRMRIEDSTGNVGIGTTSPGAKLDVSSTTGGKIRLTRTDTQVIADEVAGEIAFYTTDITDANENAYIRAVKDTLAVGTVPLDITFGTGVGGVVDERMRILYNGYVGIGTTTPTSKLEVNGAISSASLTVTASANNTNVAGVNTMWITTSGGAVVLGGLTGGVDGQVLYIIRKDTTNDLTLEHAEGAGNQDFIMHQGSDEVIDAGGVVLVCDGSDWYDVSHAKHV